MKNYKKTHLNKSVLNKHVAKIKGRGGVCTIKGLTVTYHFPLIGSLFKKYDTEEKRIAFLKTEGNIVTFKKPFKWKEREFSQILISSGLEESKSWVKIIGMHRDSPPYKTMSQLLNAIDWKLMEAWHSD